MLCPEVKSVSVLRLNILWKTKAGGRESKLYKRVARPFLQSFRCFFFFSSQQFSVLPYLSLSAVSC